jgi:hypothetical protein
MHHGRPASICLKDNYKLEGVELARKRIGLDI